MSIRTLCLFTTAGAAMLAGAPALAEYRADCVEGIDSASVQIWFGRDGFIPDDAFASFRELYPQIEVRVDTIPLEQQPADFVRKFGTDDAPDIIQPEFSEIGVLARRGMLMDVTEILTEWKESNPDLYGAMTPTAWEMASFEGTPHGLALHHGVYWNVYRPDVFTELGISVPETWDDVLTAGEAISEAKDAEGGGMYGYTLNGSASQSPEWSKSRFAQMGGQWVDGVMQIDSEPGHYWLNWHQRAVALGVISPNTIAFEWPDVVSNFRSNKAAMAQMSRNAFPADLAPHLAYGEKWEINPEPYTMPGHEAAARYVTNGWPYVVNAEAASPCAVGLVLQYLADDPQSLSEAVRYQPVSNGRVLASDAYLEVAPWGAVMVEPWAELEVLPYHANQVAMNRVIRDAMQEAIQNPEADVAEMAAEFQEKLDELGAQGR